MKLLKNFSNKIALKKAYSFSNNRDLSKRNDPIKTIGFLIDDSFGDVSAKIISTFKNYNLHAKDIKIFTFANSNMNDTTSSHNQINESHFSFRGKILNVDAEAFSDLHLDCLVFINYNQNIYLNLLAAKSKAHFKIGFFNSEELFFDLIFKARFDKFDSLIYDLTKYLKILKKL